MNDTALSSQLQNIEQKLDVIYSEMELAKRHRQEMQELKEDLSLIAKDMFESVILEMDEVAPFVQTGDFLNLMKKFLRNIDNINSAVSRIESGLDFFEDWRPIGRELFNDGLEKLDEIDRKGYFGFLGEALAALDNIITHFSPEDVHLLAENIVPILETVKNLTQPEVLAALNNVLTTYQNLDKKAAEEYSIWKAMKELRTPEAKRSIGFAVTFLKSISQEQPTPQDA